MTRAVHRAALAGALLCPLALAAQLSPPTGRATDANPSIIANQGLRQGVMLDTAALNTLRWREVGPFRGGRSVAVAGSVARPNEYYMGTTGGGVFKTLDGGQSWAPVTDKYFGGTIGAVAVSPSNPDIVYVGGGEFPMRGNVSHGDGVWKSTDAGKTWTSLGLDATRHISKVRVHPTNPDIVYVAAQGNVWAPSPDRGIYVAEMGASASRASSSATTPRVRETSRWTRTTPTRSTPPSGRRAARPGSWCPGGSGSSIHKSTDGGATWQDISRNPGLPAGLLGNMGITVSGANSRRVWAIIEADSGGVYRSDDAGASWRRLNADRALRQRAWYYSKIHADPKDTNVVYVNNVGFHKSTNGGRTFTQVRGVPHSDSHDLWIAPNDPKRMIEGDDGGASVTVDGGRTWSEQDFATAQFYHVITTNHFPYKICGAQQDNSTLCGPSRKAGGIDITDWQDAGGGESGYIAPRRDDPDIVYAGSYGGLLTRKDMRTGLSRNINAYPDNPMGHSAIDLQYRFQWTFPIVVSPHNSGVLYATSNYVHRSTNEGQSWQVISGDLTRNDPATLGPWGGPLTKDQTSVEYYGTIFAFAESPKVRGVLWAGSDDGLLHVSRDNGATWRNVTPPDMAPNTRVSIIEPGQFAAGTAYVAANRFQLADTKPYLWKTTNYGATWTRIDAGITSTEFTRVIREDPERQGLLYAGTERGVWFSPNDGASWQRLQLNLPMVPVHDLAVKEGDLIAGTHGRSFWVIDDLSPLRQLSPSVTASEAHLFKSRDAYRVSFASRRGGGAAAPAAGAAPAIRPIAASPSGGPVINYWLKRAGRTVTLEFLDARGTLIRSFTSLQDSTTAADSVARAARTKTRVDSIVATGVPADSAQRLASRRTDPAGGEVMGGAGDDDDGPVRTPPPPRAPNRAGINSFNWNMRYADASTFDGLIMWSAGTQGPMAPPGTYQVRLLVDGAQIGLERFRLMQDPRTNATAADLAAQFAFLTQVRDRTSAAHDAVKTIRSVKTQLGDREGKLTGAPLGELRALSVPFRMTLSVIEDSIYQTKNQSGQDPLNYPIRLNNKIAALAGVAGSAEARPTDQTVQTFTRLDAQLTGELTRLKRELDSTLPRINAVLRANGQKEIVPTTKEAPKPRPIADDDLM